MSIIFALIMGFFLCLAYQHYDQGCKAKIAEAEKKARDAELDKATEVAALRQQMVDLAASVRDALNKKTE